MESDVDLLDGACLVLCEFESVYLFPYCSWKINLDESNNSTNVAAESDKSTEAIKWFTDAKSDRSISSLYAISLCCYSNSTGNKGLQSAKYQHQPAQQMPSKIMVEEIDRKFL
ncbi:uncharacterized protein LOC141671108 [Apium graveolens]|uniref:uncharacterized protein LOC141671108 n=1 Tax=Apium graveolens TaxID=4045 RepID=UPI003D7AB2AF